MWVEFGDDVDDAFAVGGGEAVEFGAAQPSSRRVDIDADESSDPWF